MKDVLAAIDLANSKQRLFTTGAVSEQKRKAKQRAAELLEDCNYILDVGGEDFYKQDFKGEVLQLNLPNDVHSFTSRKKFDGICMMHVLEHSPVPLAILLMAHRLLKKDGLIYVAVPDIRNQYFLDMDEHFTMMPQRMWSNLIKKAGFSIELSEDGDFNSYAKAWEHRFLARKS